MRRKTISSTVSLEKKKKHYRRYLDLASSGEVNENMWIGMVKVDGKFFNIDGSPVSI